MWVKSKYFRQFIFIALTGTILLAVSLAAFYYHMAERNLYAVKVEQGQLLSRYLSHIFWDEIVALFRAAERVPPGELSSLPEVKILHRAMQLTAEEFKVIDIKIHNLKGITVYSSDPKQIGLDMMSHPGVASSLAGNSFSTIVGPGHYEYDLRLGKRDLLESYVPVRDSDSNIVGVLEVYDDLTPLLQRIGQVMRWILVGGFGFLSLFYLLLVGLFARTDKALRREQETTRRYLQKIEEDRETLEQRVAERTEEAEKSDNYLRAVMDSVPLPVVVIDREYRIDAMNQAAREMIRVEAGNDQPIYCYQAGHHRDEPCDGTDFPCTLREVLASGASITALHEHFDRDGSLHLVEVMGSPLRDANGEISGVVEVCHDITEREQVRQQLQAAKDEAEAASDAKSRFLANMSHELRTPLTTVIGMTEVLARTPLESEQRNYLETIGHSGQALLGMIDDILNLSRIEAGKETLHKTAFDLHELLSTVFDIVAYQGYAKGLELILRLAPEAPLRLQGFPTPLRQILLNLIGNAIKFTDEGEVTVSITVLRRNEASCLLRFDISDTGIGVPQEQLEQLFEPFVQAEHAHPRGQSGVGLGLSICRSLLKLMCDEAALKIVSETNVGTRFFFDLEFPIDHDDGTERPQAAMFAGASILIVDASRGLCESLADWLASLGPQPRIATSQKQALQILQQAATEQCPFALAIVGGCNGDKDGFALARLIRNDPELASTRILMLVLPQETGVDARQQEIGFDHYIRKPIKPLSLVAALQSIGDTSSRPPTSVKSTASEGDNQDETGVARDTLLLVEDHPVNREVLAQMLRDLGYAADTAATGREALQAVEQRPYRIVLMDCQLPDMTGLEVTAEIRRREGDHRQARIIAVTALALENEKERCLAVGMDDFLAKPVTFESLQQTLQKWSSEQDAISYASLPRDSGLLDPEVWDRYRQTQATNPDFIPHLIDLFQEDSPIRLERMREAVKTDDWSDVAKSAHALKGACAQMGADSLAQLCQGLMAAAQAADGIGVNDLLGELEGEYQRVSAELNRRKAAGG